MITRQRKNSILRRLWMPLLTAGFLGYFGFHAFNGSFGILAADRMEAEAAGLKVELKKLKEQRAVLEKRISYLRPDSLDADLVDVEARSALNMMRADELLVTMSAPQQ